MIDFNFFVDEPQFLGGIQTIVAAFVTIIVLCLFHDKTNFIRSLVIEFGGGLFTLVYNYISNLKEIIHHGEDLEHQDASKKVLNNLSYWLKVASKEEQKKLNANRISAQNIEMNFIVKALKIKRKYENKNKCIDDSKGLKHIELHLLIYSVLILTLDAICVNPLYLSFFVNISFLLSMLFDIFLLTSYFSLTTTLEKENVTLYKNIHWKKKLKLTLLISISIILWMTLCWSFCNFITSCIILLVLFSILFLYALSTFKKNKPAIRSNNRFVSKHVLYIYIVFIIPVIFLYAFHNYSFFDDFIIENNMVLAYNNFKNNAMMFCNNYFSRIIIVLYITIFSFFLPLFYGCIVKRLNVYLCIKGINDLYLKSQEDIKDIQYDYQKIVQKIQEH